MNFYTLIKGFIPAAIVIFASCQNAIDFDVDNKFNTSYEIINSEKAIEDVDSLLALLEQRHYDIYLNSSNTELQNQIKETKDSWVIKSEFHQSEFIIDVMKIFNTISDGHSNLLWYSEEVIPNRDSNYYFPAEVYLENGKLYVKNDTTINSDQRVALNMINGFDANLLFVDALSCLPGTAAHSNKINRTIFFPIYLHLKGILPPYTIRYDNFHVRTYTESENYLFSDLIERMQPDSKNYSLSLIEKEEIALIAYNSCTDAPAFKQFLDSSFLLLNQKSIDKVIIDIRSNSGGDSQVNDVLLSYLTRKPYQQSSKRIWKVSPVSIDEFISRSIVDSTGQNDLTEYFINNDSTLVSFETNEDLTQLKLNSFFFDGKVVVLIGPQTFSSANMLADAIKTYQICPLIGQATGERVNDFGEQKMELLLNSEIPYTYTIAYDIGASGDIQNTNTVNPDILVSGDALQKAIEYLNK